ncbi:MAG: DUF934 domain-containing protein [Deltaproteobacteria bacterium]|nr:DUF934 domain-containing protein [Deltaproteobacteria bacterium]
MRIIRNRKIVEDGWIHVADDAEVPADGDVIVSWKRWRESREALLARSGSGSARLGVRLPNTLDPHEVQADLPHFALIAVEFPKYRDGRGLSIARMVRREGFRGELRAVGNVLRDQLFYMERCGFDAFEVDKSKSIENALEAFSELSVTYQDAIQPRSVPRQHRWRRS